MSEELAQKFHNFYEKFAPYYGYETRPDTKTFDPNSSNGRLMIRVCHEIERQILDGTGHTTLAAMRAEFDAMRAEIEARRIASDFVHCKFCGPPHEEVTDCCACDGHGRSPSKEMQDDPVACHERVNKCIAATDATRPKMRILCMIGVHKWKAIELKDRSSSGNPVWRNARECEHCRYLQWEPWLRSGFIEFSGPEMERREPKERNNAG